MSSRDILNYALALSVVTITVLVAWILVYIIRLFRQVEKVVSETTAAVQKLTSVLDFVKEKISGAAALVPLVIKGVEKIVEMVKTRKEHRDTAAAETKTKTKKGA